jgi:hypothetical protein
MKINKKIVKLYIQAPYEVYWKLSNSIIPPKQNDEYITKVCYAQLSRSKRNKKYIHTFLKLTVLSNILTKKDIIKFFSLCKKNKLLPHYCKITQMVEKDKVKGTFLLSSCSLNLLYIYLCVVRIPRETPGIVKIIVYLCNKGVDFFIALSIAHSFANTGIGHSILPISKKYGDTIPKKFYTDNLKALKILVTDRKFKKKDNKTLFCLHNQLRSIKKSSGKYDMKTILTKTI